jgi:hypothetical protein
MLLRRGEPVSDYVRAHNCADILRERDEARAALARVEALCVEWEDAREEWLEGKDVPDASYGRMSSQVRAAIRGEG